MKHLGNNWKPGEVVVSNHPVAGPYCLVCRSPASSCDSDLLCCAVLRGTGGSHLPDMTVITPVFSAEGQHSQLDLHIFCWTLCCLPSPVPSDPHSRLPPAERAAHPGSLSRLAVLPPTARSLARARDCQEPNQTLRAVLICLLCAGEKVFFVASRGHHSDIGGITPGSMPPFR